MSGGPQILTSFVPVAADSHFPIQNLPYGVFSRPGEPRRVGVAIGDQILDLATLGQAGLLGDGASTVFAEPTINAFMQLGPERWRAVRRRIVEVLRADCPVLRDDAVLRARALVPMADATLHLPARIGGYTDFYSSRQHASNVGAMFRDPAKALLPNWLHLPVGYNGRASSVVVDGTPVRRPNGQTKHPDRAMPDFGPSRKLDFELELAFLIGGASRLGEPIPIAAAERHIFGFVLLNDWSARDIQQWEYAPLGPFNSKSFATTISPWIVPLEALQPFRVDGPVQSPEPLPYLRQSGPAVFDIELEAWLRPDGAERASRLTRTNARHLYWSPAQQLAHHTVSGCNVSPGDLMGSGTISGPSRDACGSLLEITLNGSQPVALADGASRSFIADGDEVLLTGWAQGDGYRVGFGQAAGKVLPALPAAT
ncbi:MAG: fumarylacetoacetase [Ancalomicrobiaceae bacterium]|nr:fumarylacetoacetase [Ancalomicrobiaceae bacterium]